jgi:hypothetical protein
MTINVAPREPATNLVSISLQRNLGSSFGDDKTLSSLPIPFSFHASVLCVFTASFHLTLLLTVNKIITRLTEIVRGALFLFLVGFVFF